MTLRDGSVRGFPEYNLSFKTDSTENGPDPGVSALISAGRVGDRALVIVAGPEA